MITYESMVFSLFAIWVFSPGPNGIFDKAKSWAINGYAKSKHHMRWLYQLVFCSWCTAILFALIIHSIYWYDFFATLAICEFVALLTIFKKSA